MTDYTPTTDEVRGDYAHFQTPAGVPDITVEYAEGLAEFDRWLAKEKADTIREVADRWTQGAWASTPRHSDRVTDRMAASQYAGDWLRAEADRIEEGN